MYQKEMLQSLASPSNVLKILKKNDLFYDHCIEERLAKGEIVTTSRQPKYFYLIEYGHLKYKYTGLLGIDFSYIVQPGDFPLLPITEEDSPLASEFTALTKVTWWKIDFSFFRKLIMQEENGDLILLQHLLNNRTKLFYNVIRDRMDGKGSIYFTLDKLLDMGFRKGVNEVELPEFLTYDLLAELSHTSRAFAAQVLADLRRQGVLLSNKKPWIVTDEKLLRQLLAESIPPTVNDPFSI
ncbi:Crp/Fnr family transcriptional regulator [Listeria booriae]|uniref:Crp/Fnr family transcriptional regulator n=1 Tax=Listeria booriae TaxID=1552123 RepID=UPI00162A85F6|nr:Crp/Fnr family transcriptional regulator [Listeria booriae]MBC2159696.1 Crp/Fnr family transcriptional regulator [Listeria booriae]